MCPLLRSFYQYPARSLLYFVLSSPRQVLKTYKTDRPVNAAIMHPTKVKKTSLLLFVVLGHAYAGLATDACHLPLHSCRTNSQLGGHSKITSDVQSLRASRHNGVDVAAYFLLNSSVLCCSCRMSVRLSLIACMRETDISLVRKSYVAPGWRSCTVRAMVCNAMCLLRQA